MTSRHAPDHNEIGDPREHSTNATSARLFVRHFSTSLILVGSTRVVVEKYLDVEKKGPEHQSIPGLSHDLDETVSDIKPKLHHVSSRNNVYRLWPRAGSPFRTLVRFRSALR